MLKRDISKARSNANTSGAICFQLLFLYSLFTSFLVFGQSRAKMTNDQIDSLIIAEKPTYQNNKAYGLENYKIILNNAISNGYTKGTVYSYFHLAGYYQKNDFQLDSALYYYDQAILLINKTGIAKKNILTGSHSNKGILLAESGMDFLSLASFEKAYKAALEEGDYYNILLVKTNLAELNRVLQNNEKAIGMANELLSDPETEKDELGKAILNGIIGASLVQSQKPKQGLSFLKISDSIERNAGVSTNVRIDTHTWIAQAYLDMENLDSAISTCENILAEFPDYQGKVKQTYLIFGKALLKKGQTALGIQTLEKALKKTGSKKNHIAILETLANSYLSQNELRKSQPLFTKATKLRDSIQTSRAKQFSKYSSISYNLLETQFKNDNLAHKNEVLEAKAIKREYLLGVLILSITVILLSILGYVLWKKYYLGKKTIQSLKANEKAILEAQIKLREDELSATMVHFSKNMKTIKTIVKDLDASLAKKDYGALQIVKNSLQEYQKSSSTASLLTDRIESQYPGISMQLRELYPNFSPNDIKHCLMIKLGLSLKETAQLFNITIAAVKSARGRMRKKMDLDPDISLKQHLSFIAKSA